MPIDRNAYVLFAVQRCAVVTVVVFVAAFVDFDADLIDNLLSPFFSKAYSSNTVSRKFVPTLADRVEREARADQVSIQSNGSSAALVPERMVGDPLVEST